MLLAAYEASNSRDVESVLATMHPDVVWPNGMDGGHVHGHGGVRDYWTRQWSVIDPHVEPLRFGADDAAQIVVDVYDLRDGLIRTMEIREPTSRSREG